MVYKTYFLGQVSEFFVCTTSLSKNNVIKNLARRVCLLTHPMLRKEKIREAKKLLFENCYPKHLVNSIFENVVKFCYNGFPPPKLFEKTEFVVCPYVSSCSEKIRSVLKPHGYTLVTSIINQIYKISSLVRSQKSQLKSCQEFCMRYRVEIVKASM